MRIDSVRTDGHVMENLADRIHKIHTVYIYIYINIFGRVLPCPEKKLTLFDLDMSRDYDA